MATGGLHRFGDPRRRANILLVGGIGATEGIAISSASCATRASWDGMTRAIVCTVG